MTVFWVQRAINQSEFHLSFPLRASCARAKVDLLFKRQNFKENRLNACVSREKTDLLMREQIGRLILIHAMTIHYDILYFNIAPLTLDQV